MIEAFETEEAWAAAAAEILAGGLRAAVDERARASLIATGGSTPGPIYDRLAAARLPWERVVVTLSDERCDPAELNETVVRERLLRGEAAKARFLPLFHGAAPEEEALAAQAVLGSLIPFDAVLLGMGSDGHIASLFPADPGLGEALDPNGSRLAVGVARAGLPPHVSRVSLTLHALASAGRVVLAVRGEAKRRLLEDGAQGLPVAALLRHAPVRVLWAP